MTVRTYIRVRFQWEGLHYWEDAPEGYEFLRDPHRHQFQGKATIETTHGDRELEFFAVLAFMKEEVLPFMGGMDDPKPASCEMFAESIMGMLQKEYGDNRYYSVEVAEDGENSGLIEMTP